MGDCEDLRLTYFFGSLGRTCPKTSTAHRIRETWSGEKKLPGVVEFPSLLINKDAAIVNARIAQITAEIYSQAAVVNASCSKNVPWGIEKGMEMDYLYYSYISKHLPSQACLANAFPSSKLLAMLDSGHQLF